MTTGDVEKFGRDSITMITALWGGWTKSAQAIAAEVVDYAKKSAENSAAAWEKLVTAKSLEKAMDVQSAYLRSSYEDFAARVSKLGELHVDLAKETSKPFEGALAKLQR